MKRSTSTAKAFRCCSHLIRLLPPYSQCFGNFRQMSLRKEKQTWTPSCTLTSIARLEDWWGARLNWSTQPVQPPLSPAHVPTAYPPVQGDLTISSGEIRVFVQHMDKLLTVIPWRISKKQLCKQNKYDFTHLEWSRAWLVGAFIKEFEALQFFCPISNPCYPQNPPWLFPLGPVLTCQL